MPFESVRIWSIVSRSNCKSRKVTLVMAEEMLINVVFWREDMGRYPDCGRNPGFLKPFIAAADSLCKWDTAIYTASTPPNSHCGIRACTA